MTSENKENVADLTAFGSNLIDEKLIKEDMKKEIERYLAEGKRHMIGHDYQTALEPLSQCCNLICTNFGELDSQLADPAYQYGICLFEVSREQQGVFGTEIESKTEVPEGDKKADPILGGEKNEAAGNEDEERLVQKK